VSKKSALFNIKDLIVYFLVAGAGAAVQFLSGSFFRDFYGYTTSVALGYIVSSIVGFILTKLFAFDARNSSKTRREMVKFGIVVFISFGITVGVSTLSNSIIHSLVGEKYYTMYFSFIPFLPERFHEFTVNVNESLGLLIAMGVSFISNYILHKTFTFKSTGFYNRAKSMLKLGK